MSGSRAPDKPRASEPTHGIQQHTTRAQIMWNSRNRTATLIVFSALRKYTGAIRADIRNFHLDAERSEELDEAIRLTRTMRSATSLIGSYALNRVASLLEETLESIANQQSCLDDVAIVGAADDAGIHRFVHAPHRVPHQAVVPADRRRPTGTDCRRQGLPSISRSSGGG